MASRNMTNVKIELPNGMIFTKETPVLPQSRELGTDIYGATEYKIDGHLVDHWYLDCNSEGDRKYLACSLEGYPCPSGINMGIIVNTDLIDEAEGEKLKARGTEGLDMVRHKGKTLKIYGKDYNLKDLIKTRLFI